MDFAEAINEGIAQATTRNSQVTTEMAAVLEEVRGSVESLTGGQVSVAYKISWPEPFPVLFTSRKDDGTVMEDSICAVSYCLAGQGSFTIERHGRQRLVRDLDEFRGAMAEVLSDPATGKILYQLAPSLKQTNSEGTRRAQIAAFRAMVDAVQKFDEENERDGADDAVMLDEELRLFGSIINIAAELLQVPESEMAQWFGCTTTVIRYWREGQIAPHPAMRTSVCRFLLRRIEQADAA